MSSFTRPVQHPDIAAELARLRYDAGLTQARAAKRMGWSEARISRIEHGTALEYDSLTALLDMYEAGPETRDAVLALTDPHADPPPPRPRPPIGLPRRPPVSKLDRIADELTAIRELLEKIAAGLP